MIDFKQVKVGFLFFDTLTIETTSFFIMLSGVEEQDKKICGKRVGIAIKKTPK